MKLIKRWIDDIENVIEMKATMIAKRAKRR